MEPVPETAQVLRSLNETSERDLASTIGTLAERVVAIAPSWTPGRSSGSRPS